MFCPDPFGRCFAADLEGSLVGGLTGNAARGLFSAAGRAVVVGSSAEDCFDPASDEFCDGNQLAAVDQEHQL